MAKNANPKKTNRHELYLAATGYGKTTAMKRSPMLKKTRLIVWDPGRDHKTRSRATTLQQFLLLLTQQAASSNGISLALSLDRPTARHFEFFCKAVWSILDGKKDTVIVVEEAAAIQVSNGRAGPEWGGLIREGRKFGAVILATSQRAQEMDKTLFTQVQTKWIGCHDIRDAQHIAKLVAVDPEQVYGLEQGQFLRKELGPKPAELVDFKKRGRRPRKQTPSNRAR